ncbi:MAG: thioesterase [Clostridia bacterium]
MSKAARPLARKESIEMDEKTQLMTLRMCDCDADGRWKYSEILREMQELGEAHADEMGFSRACLIEKGMCWVLYRQIVRLSANATLGDAVTMTTWPGARAGLFFPRHHLFEMNGQPLGQATAAWVLFDIEKRCVLRPTMLPGDYRPAPRTAHLALPGALPLPEGEDAGTRRVQYTDIDLNGHMNNARYADWVQDLLPNRAIHLLQINYQTEGYPGDLVRFTLKALPDRARIKAVKSSGQPMFEAEACWAAQ